MTVTRCPASLYFSKGQSAPKKTQGAKARKNKQELTVALGKKFKVHLGTGSVATCETRLKGIIQSYNLCRYTWKNTRLLRHQAPHNRAVASENEITWQIARLWQHLLKDIDFREVLAAPAFPKVLLMISTRPARIHTGLSFLKTHLGEQWRTT